MRLLQQSRSIRQKLNAILLIAIVSALVVAGIALVLLDLRTQATAVQKDLVAQADLVALASSAALAFDDPKAGAENLRVLRANPAIVSAALYRADGRMFAVYSPGGAELPATAPATREQVEMDWSTIRVLRPLPAGNDAAGLVFVQARHELGPRALQRMAVLAAILAVSLGVAVVLSKRLQQSIATPIIEVSRAAQGIRRGDFSLRAQKTTSDEIGDLVEAFNAMAAELQRRDGELRESNKAKDDFIATLAHELRNPLAPIRTGLEILKIDKGRTGASDRARQTMERQLLHMVRLVDDLLDISRITNGKIHLAMAPVKLAAVVESALEQSRPAFETAGQQLQVRLEDPDVEVNGDATRLAQAVGNLLNNAAKYTPRGGNVVLRVAREGDQAVIEVRDDGIGIPPAMLDKVFDMFTQVNRALEWSQGGLGIGLALVRSLVALHGGTVTAASDGEGRGSTFTIRLPCVPAVAPAPGPADPAASRDARAASGGKRRVLVVDDNVDAADTLAAMLELVGYDSRSLSDPEKVSEVADEFEPHAILLDIGMPRVSGYSVARQLRGEPRHADTLLIAVTGWGAENDRQKSREAGFDWHLTKPVDVQDVVRVLEAAAPA